MIRALVTFDTSLRAFRYEPAGVMASPLPMMARAVALVPTPADAAVVWPKPSTAGANGMASAPRTVASVDKKKKKTL